MEPAQQPPTESRFWEWGRFALVLVLLLWLFFCGTWCTYWAELRHDCYQLLDLGYCLREGGQLYVDCWENKPPGIAWLNGLGLALTPRSDLGPWILPGVVGFIAVCTFWVSVRALLSLRAARRSALIAALIGSMRLFDAPSINPDTYAFAFELIALSLWLLALRVKRDTVDSALPQPISNAAAPDVSRHHQRGGVLFAIGAGLAWAAASAVKQVAWVGPAAISLMTLIMLLTRWPDRRRWLRVTAWTLAGLGLGISIVAAVLIYQGVGGEAWRAVFAFNRRYLAAGALNKLAHSWPRIRGDLQVLQLYWWLAALAVVTIIFRGRRDAFSTPFVAAMLVWMVLAAVFALLGPSNSTRYWQAIFAPLLWLGAVGLHEMRAAYMDAAPRHRFVMILVAISVTVLLLRPTMHEYRYGLASVYASYGEEPNERGRYREMGRRIAELVPPGRRIFVWAYDSGLYVHSDRRPASRFTHALCAEQMQEILADLSAGKAEAILVPDRTSAYFTDWCADGCKPELDAILKDYAATETLGRYTVWTKSPAR